MSLQKSNGLKGMVKIKDGASLVDVGALQNWELSADAKNIIDLPTVFGKTRDEQILGTKQVRTFSGSGVYDVDEDAGQAAIRDAFNDSTYLAEDEIKFYINIDEGKYWTPDEHSTCQISSVDAMTQSSDGFCTWNFEGICHGDMILKEDD